MGLVAWREDEKEAFLRSQFEAQDKWYRGNYRAAEFSVILLDEEPVGRLYLARWKEEIRIMDIALLPDFRGRGIGSSLMETLLEEGRSSGRKVSIHVEKFNPALRWYERLGFEMKEDKGVYLFLEWSPK